MGVPELRGSRYASSSTPAPDRNSSSALTSSASIGAWPSVGGRFASFWISEPSILPINCSPSFAAGFDGAVGAAVGAGAAGFDSAGGGRRAGRQDRHCSLRPGPGHEQERPPRRTAARPVEPDVTATVI
jgi:hypothetical protein